MADYAIHEETLTGISNVIRKKDGTSALIDPADYADRINLMGALEEKTASGSIAHITDGADRVPLKKCEVTLPASLDGYSEVDVVHTGANLVALNVSPQQAKRDFGVTVNTQTADILNITSTGIAYSCERLFYSFKKGTYSIKFLATSSDSFTPVISIYRTNGTGVKFNIQPNTLTTFTLAGDADIDIRLFASGSGDTTVRTVEFSYLQIEVGSTVSAYSQYNSTIYTASLGRTIYGGTADVVAGSGTEEYSVPIALSSLTWTKENNHFYSNALTTLKGPVNNTVPANIVVSSPYTNMAYSSMIGEGTDKSISLNNSKRIYIYDSEVTDTTELETALSGKYLVGELATPETFTFTPISPTPETALGVNNFWADSGDSEVTYRGQGTVYQYPEGEGVSF